MADIELCRMGGSEREAWDSYVRRTSESSYAHLSGWKDVIQNSYGQQGYYLWAKENEKICGILPLVYIRSLCFGNAFVSLPFLDEAGICADSEEIQKQLLEEGGKLAKEKGISNLEFRHRQHNSLPLTIFGDKVAMVLDLPGNSDELWKALDAKVRNQVRKGMKSDLSIQWAGVEGLTEFYNVFSINMRDLASPVHSRRFFEKIFLHFSREVKLILIRKDDVVVAGGIVFAFRNTVFMPWASSRREYRALCPNILMYWEAIKWACDAGMEYFDFGRSSMGAGTYHFKKQWGARDIPLHWQNTRNSTRGVVLNKDEAKFRWAMKIWRKLPLSFTTFVGPWLRGQMSN